MAKRRDVPERKLGEWWSEDDMVVQAEHAAHNERMRGLDNEDTRAFLRLAVGRFVRYEDHESFIDLFLPKLIELLSEEAYKTARGVAMRRPGGCPHYEPCDECIAERHV